MLVFAADLEEVEEVGCGCVDGDEVFVRFGGGRREVEDFEVFRALGTLVWGRCVDWRDKRATLTYSLICMPFIVDVMVLNGNLLVICNNN